MAYQSSIKLTKVVERFELEVLNAGKNYDHCLVRADDINRPALQILGFFDYFAPRPDPGHRQGGVDLPEQPKSRGASEMF